MQPKNSACLHVGDDVEQKVVKKTTTVVEKSASSAGTLHGPMPFSVDVTAASRKLYAFVTLKNNIIL